MLATNGMMQLRQATEATRKKLVQHSVYQLIDSAEALKTFMESHVFAVWDFMTLLKSLQNSQTCVSVPWLPTPNRATARFINEIVCGEESDEDGAGGHISHFDLYLEAMAECGASCESIDAMLHSLRQGIELPNALALCVPPNGVEQFVRSTWSFVQSGKPHIVAAAFTFGREDIIPDMFRQFVHQLNQNSGGGYERSMYYLLRHMDLDEHSHAPLAMKAMLELCGTDAQLWQEATEAAIHALEARIRLWDAIADAIGSTKQHE